MKQIHLENKAKLDDALTIRTGTHRDYAALAEHHYRAGHPATYSRVLVFEHDRPTVIGRYLHRPSHHQVAAVLVESLPAISCQLRDEATSNRYRAFKDARQRARVLNSEVRCISRVVVHPQWRGLGLAVRLVREALSSATTQVTEAIAAMGHINPFFERAGMLPYHRVPRENDARLIAALHAMGLSELDLVRPVAMLSRIESLLPSDRDFILHELGRWHKRTKHQHEDDPARLIEAARTWLLCDPVYYLHLR